MKAQKTQLCTRCQPCLCASSEGVSVTDAINRGVSLLDARLHVKIARNYHDLAAIITKQAPVAMPRATGAMAPSNIE